MIYMPIAAALIGLVYMLIKKSWVMKQDAGDGKMKEISDHIYEGALAFLNAEYRLLSYFVLGASIVLAGIAFFMDTTYLIVVAFIIGAVFSAFAGNMGMKIATKTNVRTTQAAKTSLPNALKVSFGGGTVMGLGVAGLAVLGLTLFFIVFYQMFMGGQWTNTMDMTIVLEALAGFSLGAESIALFARVGGGIYTKAADVGADLAGKVQADIPEDDPRNPATMQMDFFGEGLQDISSMRVFYACLVGLVVGAGISAFTEYYTGLGSKPILKIVQQSSTGAGTNIIAGLATGMISTFSSVLLFAAAIWASYALAGFYGVALAASAMMATTAMQLAIDAFGPIADNAGGIAEMSEQDPIVRERTDILDAVGNTTAATGKGFAIASAALTSLALFAAYVTFTGIDGINIFKAPVLAMLFVGGMVPVVFSALAMNAVGKAAMEMVNEVVRQFKEIPGIMEGTGKPEYDKCVAISTEASLKEMMLPGLLTIGFPIVIVLIGLLVYPDNNMLVAEMLGGYMAGVTVSGVLWAIFQNNAGGAWDNAKKSFEAGVEINGVMTYKGSEAHKAAVTGDTVGDPFKDTSGPSMNILIKLTCLIGLVIAPILGGHADADTGAVVSPTSTMQVKASTEDTMDVEKDVTVNMTSDEGVFTAEVVTETKLDGATQKETKIFTGTEAEVKAKIAAMNNVVKVDIN